MNYLLVFLGGGLGSLIRYLISVYLPQNTKGFPWHTFIANMVACILIGSVMGVSMTLFQNTLMLYCYSPQGFVVV